MNILIVAATDFELEAIRKNFDIVSKTSTHQYRFLSTGIGVARSTFALAKELLLYPVDFVIQVGLAGSFTSKLNIGDTVWVVKDTFSDLGAQTDGGFLSLKDLALADADFEVSFRQELCPHIPLPKKLIKVSAITADTIHNQKLRIEEIKKQFNPQVESMEGAAIMNVCNKLNIANIQVRSISNMVAPREENRWNAKVALSSLNLWLFDYLASIENAKL